MDVLPAPLSSTSIPTESVESGGPRKLDIPLSSSSSISPLTTKLDVKDVVKEVVKEVVKQAVKEVVLENNHAVVGPQILPAIDLIKTCTPDCTLSHCTEACKCANTHADAQAKCNPPPNAAITELCHIWYHHCPMFKPLMFDAAGPTPFL